ncbi:MAG: winged helix-turn-helix transcriptional regulator [Pirellulales bacterium]|nr:winged helix-turn-helix transcriptional regulator [Pirellulales bacterium]
MSGRFRAADYRVPHGGFKDVKDTPADASWNERARLLRVMAHPVRLMILKTLCERPTCVKDINSLVPLVQPHFSQHMAALRKAGLVDCHVCGPLRCYYIVRPTLVKKILQLLSEEHPVKRRSRSSVVRASRRVGEAKAGAR